MRTGYGALFPNRNTKVSINVDITKPLLLTIVNNVNTNVKIYDNVGFKSPGTRT